MRFALRYSLFTLAFASSLTSTVFAIPLQRDSIEVAGETIRPDFGHQGHHLTTRGTSIPLDDSTLAARDSSFVWHDNNYNKLESGAIALLAKRAGGSPNSDAHSSTRPDSSHSSSSGSLQPASQPSNARPPLRIDIPPPYTEFRIASTQSRPNTPSEPGSIPPSPHSWTSSQSTLVSPATSWASSQSALRSPAPPYSPPRSPISRPPSSLGSPPPYEEQPNHNANGPSSGGGRVPSPNLLTVPERNPRNRNPYRNPNSNQPPRRRSLSYEEEAQHPFAFGNVRARA